MNRMAEIKDFLEGEFVTEKDVKDDDTAIILDEPKINSDTPFGKDQLEATIELSDKRQKTYGMNRTSAMNLSGAWGSDTKAWVGKKIKFTKLKQNVKGTMKDVIYAKPA